MTVRGDFIRRGGAWRPARRPVSQFLPAGQITRVMAVGDSLTLGQGNEGMGGYRLRLWSRLKAAGFTFLPVGASTQPPWSDNGHEYYGSRWTGYGGWKMGDLAGTGTFNTTGKAMTEWVTDWDPAVLLLMIGTNDLAETSNQTTLLARFNALLDVVYAAKTSIDVVLGRVPQYQTTTWQAVTDFNDNAVAALSSRAAGDPDRRVAVANMETIRGADKYVDHVHLNAAGYAEAAGVWFDAIVDD